MLGQVELGTLTEPAGGASPVSTVGRPGRAAARGARARSHFMLIMEMGYGSGDVDNVNLR
jgi:hypothetical protein